MDLEDIKVDTKEDGKQQEPDATDDGDESGKIIFISGLAEPGKWQNTRVAMREIICFADFIPVTSSFGLNKPKASYQKLWIKCPSKSSARLLLEHHYVTEFGTKDPPVKCTIARKRNFSDNEQVLITNMHVSWTQSDIQDIVQSSGYEIKDIDNPIHLFRRRPGSFVRTARVHLINPDTYAAAARAGSVILFLVIQCTSNRTSVI